MKKVMIGAALALLCCVSVMWATGDTPAETPGDGQEVKAPAPEKKVTIDEYLIGAWMVEARPGVLSEEITFRKDGTYSSDAKHEDGTGVGVKGQYILYTDLKPCGIDLCPGKCGQPGSEWTTSFGILRMLEDGRVEIRTSPTQNRPTDFGTEKELYTMFLTRLPVEKD